MYALSGQRHEGLQHDLLCPSLDFTFGFLLVLLGVRTCFRITSAMCVCLMLGLKLQSSTALSLSLQTLLLVLFLMSSLSLNSKRIHSSRTVLLFAISSCTSCPEVLWCARLQGPLLTFTLRTSVSNRQAFRSTAWDYLPPMRKPSE